MTVRELYKNQLIDLVLAAPGSRREGIRMGAVRHGTTILDRPKATTNIPSYNLCERKISIAQPSCLYPLILGNSWPSGGSGIGPSPDDYGEHLWSFIPNRLLSRLQENATRIEYLMDLPPVVKDMRMVKKGRTSPQLLR